MCTSLPPKNKQTCRIASSRTRMVSYPLERDPPAGASAMNTSSRLTRSGSRLGPLGRRFPLGLPGLRFVAFSMPDDLNGGRGGRFFKRAISSSKSWFSTCRVARAISVFSSSSRSSATCASRAPSRCDRSTTSRRRASDGNVSDPSSESGPMPYGIRHLPQAQRSCPKICPSYPPCPCLKLSTRQVILPSCPQIFPIMRITGTPSRVGYKISKTSLTALATSGTSQWPTACK